MPAICETAVGKLLPYDQWKWERSSPEVAALRPFDGAAASRDVRISTDLDTGVSRLEFGAAIPGSWRG